MSGYLSKPPPGVQIGRAHPLARGLVFCSLINEGGGMSVMDAVTGKLALAANGPQWAGQGLRFAQASEHSIPLYSTPTTLYPGSGNYTATLLFRYAGLAGAANRLLDNGQNFSTNPGFTIFADGTILVVRCRDSATRASQSVSFTDTQSFHVVSMVVDRQRAQIIGYLDGSNKGWIAGGGGPTSDSLAGVGSIDSGALAIGGGIAAQRWNGDIGFVAIHNRALSPSGIASLHAQPYQMFPFMRAADVVANLSAVGIALLPANMRGGFNRASGGVVN